VDTNNRLEIDLLTISKERFLSVPYGRAKAVVPVLFATSSISEAFNKVKFSECLNSHNSFEEQEHCQMTTPPAASFRIFPTRHLRYGASIKVKKFYRATEELQL
jgi:hypothetical protein